MEIQRGQNREISLSAKIAAKYPLTLNGDKYAQDDPEGRFSFGALKIAVAHGETGRLNLKPVLFTRTPSEALIRCLNKFGPNPSEIIETIFIS